MYHCATVSQPEAAQLRQVTDVVRLGRVLSIDADRIVLEQGSIPTGSDQLHIDCSAAGVPRVARRPIFEHDRITVQQVRTCAPTFNAALIGYVEATRDDVAARNRLCPPNPIPDAVQDWLLNLVTSLQAADAWSAEPDLRDWLERSRLNLYRGIRGQANEPRMQQALQRYRDNRQPGVARLRQLIDPHRSG